MESFGTPYFIRLFENLRRLLFMEVDIDRLRVDSEIPNKKKKRVLLKVN